MTKYLRTDEKVLWSGKPMRAAFLLPIMGMVPFGFVFLTILAFVLREALAGGVALTDLLGVFFFMAMVSIIFFGPSSWQVLRYRNTRYVITDQRVVSQSGAIGLVTLSVDLDKIQEVYLKIGLIDKRLGTGTVIYITPVSSLQRHGYEGWSAPLSSWLAVFKSMLEPYPNLAALKEPHQVQKQLQEAISKAGQANN